MGLIADARGSYDVAVVGGGPAGSAAAIELRRRGATVVLLEATRYDTERYGETLAPEINPLLRALGVADLLTSENAIACPGTIAIWGEPNENETAFVHNAHGHGWHVDRKRFDLALGERARLCGATLEAGIGRVRAREIAGGGWEFATARATYRAGFAIDASGTAGLRMHAGDARIVHDRLIATFVRYRFARRPQDRRTVVESTPDGWWYYTPLPDGDALAAFLCAPELYRDPAFDIEEQLGRTQLIAQRVGCGKKASIRAVAAFSSRRTRFSGRRWASAGDAALSYDPLSGYGITGALTSARELAAAIQTDALPAYDAQLERRFAAYVKQRSAFYALEVRWADRPFWRARRSEVSE